MLSIEGDHILALIVGFLRRYGEDKLASKVQDKITNPEDLQEAPLASKKLEKIIKNYVLQHQELVDYYQGQPEEQVEEEDKNEEGHKKRRRENSHNEEPQRQTKKRKVSQDASRKANKKAEVEVKRDGKSTIYSKFTSPKLLETTVEKVVVEEESEGENESESEVKQKTSKEEKKKQPTKSSKSTKKPQPKSESGSSEQQQSSEKEEVEESEDEEGDEEEEEDEKEIQKQKHNSSSASANKEKKIAEVKEKYVPKETWTERKVENTGERKFFSRVNADSIGQLPENLSDNTFEAKFKFGLGDEFGKYGNEKLKFERGEGFKKMKGKLKNKGFQGGTIDPHKVNSIPL